MKGTEAVLYVPTIGAMSFDFLNGCVYPQTAGMIGSAALRRCNKTVGCSHAVEHWQDETQVTEIEI